MDGIQLEVFMEKFYLKKITLLNYRRFENETFQFNPRMNVLIGKNAAGKTTVLEAVNVLLGAYLAAYKKYVPSRFVYNITDNDIRLKTAGMTTHGTTLPSTVPQFPCTIGCRMQWDTKEISYSRTLEKEGSRTKFAGTNPMQPEVLKWENAIAKADGSDAEQAYPLILYLSSARLWNENRGSEIKSVPNRTDAYQRCLDKKRSSQSAFEYIKLLRNIASEENAGKQFPAYDAIMEAVRYSLEDELQAGQSVEYASRYSEIAVKNADGKLIQFASLSDGYRNVMKIVTDIATKMCILNPHLEGQALVKTPGVVVIDELDLSLHPTWQKRIVRILKKLFPQIQFICATHSPFIIQSLEPGELLALDTVQDEEYSGQSIEDIAEDIMQVPMPHYSEKKEQMYKAAEKYFGALNANVDAEKLEALKEELDVLSAEYSDNPAYNAFLKQKYLERKAETEDTE